MRYAARFVAIPEKTRYVPALAHPKNKIVGEQTAIVTGPGGEEIYTDSHGRVKVQFHWDREGSGTETSSSWVRVSQNWAGPHFGAMTLPRVGHEVIVSFLEGDPDRPIITGRVYHALNMPPYELPAQKNLSGIQSREVRASRRNQVILDDTNGQIQAQISSDHEFSQLNLGHMTRIRHVKGRDDYRGEGFELRTDGWGVLRAGKGMVLTTHVRKDAEQHHKDIREAVEGLAAAADQHVKQSGLAVEHKNQQEDSDKRALQEELERQSRSISGSGEKHGELTDPHLVFSSPAGIAATTPAGTHLHSGKNTAVTAGRHVSVAAGHSFLASALHKVSLFAHKAGMKLFAGRGKVEIQAQSDSLDLVAEQELRIVSTKDKVHVSAPKEIRLTAGGSYITLSESGIELGTSGKIDIRTSDFAITGPASKPYVSLAMPRADLELEPLPGMLQVTLGSALGAGIYPHEPYTLYEDGIMIGKGVTDAQGRLTIERKPEAREYKVELSTGQVILYEMVENLPDGEEGEIQRALQEGFRYYENSAAGVEKEQGLKEHLLAFLKREKINKE